MPDTDLVARAARRGHTAHLLRDSSFRSRVSMYGKKIVLPYDWSSWSMSLLHPLSGPRVSIVCGACSAPSKGPAILAYVSGQPQDWSAVQCRRCFTPNAVPIVMTCDE